MLVSKMAVEPQTFFLMMGLLMVTLIIVCNWWVTVTYNKYKRMEANKEGPWYEPGARPSEVEVRQRPQPVPKLVPKVQKLKVI